MKITDRCREHVPGRAAQYRQRLRGPSLALSLLAIVLSCVVPVARAASPAVGQPAPVLIVTQLDGQRFDLSAHRGEVVIVNLWATWCSPCRKELPMLNDFYQRHRAEGLTVLALSVDADTARKEARQIIGTFRLPAALAVDAQQNGLGSPEAVPVTYVIGRDGIIRARLMPRHGGLQQSDLEAAVLPLLREQPEGH